MEEYGRQRGLRRRIFPVPVLTPRLSSLRLRLVTPVYTRVGRQLIEGLRNETVVTEPGAAVRPRGLGGLVYGYALYPFHRCIFEGILRKIVAAASAGHSSLD
jgi:hypothetical protein